jgi:hypothetical protein
MSSWKVTNSPAVVQQERYEKMETEASRNRLKLSRNCTQIKELQGATAGALDGVVMVIYCPDS